ncbi:butyrophilin-like protein 9 isoform X1 [Lates calcarifer]|uniref:Butyrophilin-like protein 9 isoform X1 n=1 Tax=Lates calcarifer TaxID=8187 RepID=A0AAJ7PQC5_LATCA|nr:butyrophilin-like protein 9 isoform X1 [Lates calcarifer]
MRSRQTYFLWLVFLCLLFIILCAGTISINLSINTEQEHETRSTYPQNGSVSAPVISGINLNSSTVVLECESKGWYPEPEVLWLDGEGNLLSAGPTETVRGPDDLYTVSSRVTVRRGNSFICRVEQKIINQTSETKIQISGTISINLSINTEKEHETRSTYPQNGQSQVVGPSEPIVALVGDDVILPCHLEPAADVVSGSVEWGRPDLEPRFVHVWHLGQDLLVNQNPSYQGRTSVSAENLKHGDLSLRLSAVKHSDNGKYRCYFASQAKETTVELIVGSVSVPVISGINLNSSTVVLECESKGWYPEPEVLWLDGEGNLLSAGPTETVRGPDDLYTVSSRVTVEKRHSNSFTCRVRQNNINQTTETEIQISAECFPATSVSTVRFTMVLVVILIFSCVAAFVVWKWTQNQMKDAEMNQEEREREKLLAKSEKKAKLDQELQRREEEERDLDQMTKTVTEQKEELQKLIDELKRQKDEMQRGMDDIEKRAQSVEKETESDRAKGFLRLKEIILDAKRQLQERKQAQEQLLMCSQTLMCKTDVVFKKMTQRKKGVEELKEKIIDQLEETEKHRNEIQRKLRSKEKYET